MCSSAPTYEEEKVSLQWKDLLENPKRLAAQANAMGEVRRPPRCCGPAAI